MKKQNEILSLYQKTKIKKLLPFKKGGQKNFRIYFKSYPRFKKISMRVGTVPIIKDFLIKRSSERGFTKSISFEDLSSILFYSSGRNTHRISQSEHRFYPSAGGLFPLELYVINQKIKSGLEKGIYHYNLKDNSLEFINNKSDLVKKAFSESFLSKASCVILITAVPGRSSIKYSARTYRYIFIEAGHIGQNVYLCSKSRKIKCCSIGGYCDDVIEKYLDLDPNIEFPIYAIALGK
jgi:SagB-type dehydrogenase family enzyme